MSNCYVELFSSVGVDIPHRLSLPFFPAILFRSIMALRHTGSFIFFFRAFTASFESATADWFFFFG